MAITGNEIARYSWLARARLCELEITMRPLGARSRMLKKAWPGICEAIGFGTKGLVKMTIPNLTEAAKRCRQKAEDLS
jgi:hypothetical protein